MHVLKSKNEKITLYFGKQKLNGENYNHTGIDMVKSPSSLDYVTACCTGRVTTVVNNVKNRNLSKGYGNYVIIDHGNGFETLYAHLKYATIQVKVGQEVNEGTVIGYMGDTGYTFGAHLHFEVRKNKVKIDPLPYLQDKAKFTPATTTYTKGNYKTLYVMNIRTGAGTNYARKKKSQLSADGKRNSNDSGQYKVGTIFTALSIINNNDGSVWAKTPSGYICLKDKSCVYCKKV